MKFKRRDLLKSALVFGTGILQSCSTPFKKKSIRSPNSVFSWFSSKEERSLLSQRGIEKLNHEYDMIIIGSGYGASVVAARMSEENPNSNICVLERGKEYFPGDFPKTFGDVITSIRGPVNKLGLLDQLLANGEESDLDIIGASGLGGTSLINAAIAIRPLREVFEMKEWPKEIREEIDREVFRELGYLDKYFYKAEKTLESKNNSEGFQKTKKSNIFKKAVKKLSVKVGYLKLNIRYKSSDSKFDLGRNDCTMCGDCCSGCNVGAKNILPYNYLHMANENGCQIFTETNVKSIKKVGDHYEVVVADNSELLSSKKTIIARNVVLGAGSHGSTKLLLRAQKDGLSVSKKIGSRLSLNADVLGFCYNGKERTNAVGVGLSKRKRLGIPSVGTGISTFANYRELNINEKLEDQYLLLEGSIPSPLTGIVASGLAHYASLNKDKMKFSDEQWDRVKKDKKLFPSSDEIVPDGALNHSTLFLACGHDASAGQYQLNKRGGLKVVYDNVVNEKFYKTITSKMREVSKELGGYYLDNPRTSIFKGKMMATHPLGGCPMGDTSEVGVVNHKGQVFTEDGAIHKGLYVVDAAIIPRSLGATPLLTISALAERIAVHMNEDRILS